jgi:thiamine-phosphate pyrophosphorylase
MAEALSAGVRFLQYRCKNGARGLIFETALRLSRMAREAQALFIVNDHADIAAAAGADGVHLGQDDLPIEHARKLLGAKKIIGISTHGTEQAKTAEAAGADYIGFGPVFATATKDAGRVRGIDALALVKRSVGVPVFAIGGIDCTNVKDVILAGADGVAAISAILGAPDIREAAERMMEIITEARRSA